MKSWVKDNAEAVCAALESTMVAGMGNRRALAAAMLAGGGDLSKAMEAFNEERRSSLNNICGRARVLAVALRKQKDRAA